MARLQRPEPPREAVGLHPSSCGPAFFIVHYCNGAANFASCALSIGEREMGLSGETWGIILGVVGLVLTIYFGVKAATYFRSKRVSQNQKVGSNSISIQSGRDTKVGE